MRVLDPNKPLTIRHRLLLSFFIIIALFALNISFFSISNLRRANSVLELRQAITAEKSISDRPSGGFETGRGFDWQRPLA